MTFGVVSLSRFGVRGSLLNVAFGVLVTFSRLGVRAGFPDVAFGLVLTFWCLGVGPLVAVVNLNLVETRTSPDGVLLTRYETRR